jgi:Uma2 family endonuclease
MSAQPNLLTPEEYLEIERKAETKSEYFQGEMFAMAGGTPRHGWIIGNVTGGLWQRLRGKPCRVSPGDVRLRVSPTGLYTYPDVMVICGDPQYADDRKDTILNPVLIVEVLSESTRDYDRGQKFEHYRTLASVKDYLTIAQDKPHVEQWSRTEEGRWQLTELDQPGQTMELTSVGCALPLSEVYYQIDWS